MTTERQKIAEEIRSIDLSVLNDSCDPCAYIAGVISSKEHGTVKVVHSPAVFTTPKHIILCPARNNDHGQMAAVIHVPADADPKVIFQRAVKDNLGNPNIEKFILVQVVDEVRN